MTQLFAWDFAGTGQAAVADLSGNGRGFTPTGNTTRTSAGGGYTYGGARPNAVGLTQTAAGVQIGPSLTGLETASRTVCGWAKIAAAGTYWFMEWHEIAPDTGYWGWLYLSSVFRGRVKNSSGTAFEQTMTPSTSYRFYAMTFGSGTLKVYQSDGSGVVAQIGSDIAVADIGTQPDQFDVFDQSGTNVTLSDWQMFDTVKTLTELQALADTPLTAAGTTVNAAAETDAAQPVTRLRAVAAGITTETDAAQPATRLRSVPIGTITETDAAQPAGRLRSVPIGTALEVDAAQPAAHLGAVLGAAVETDAAQPVTRARLTLVGTATETDTAPPLGSGHSTAVAPASESDSAQPVQRLRAVLAAPAGETDTAVPVVRLRATSVGTAVEVDEARAVFNPNAVIRDLELDATMEPGRLASTVEQARFASTVEPGRFRTEMIAS